MRYIASALFHFFAPLAILKMLMASYKVPQDVEADDKLVGPFSFRQFVYLIIAFMAGALAWGLAQIFIVFALLPLPIILLFGALALPLRKDQPMEIYLAAIVSFYLKPHLRRWDGEGVEALIEVTAPVTTDQSRVKDLSDFEAQRRLGYLASIVDSGGWAIRGGSTSPDSALISDVFYDAQNVQDVLDTNNTVAQSFSALISQTAEKSKQEAIERMRLTMQATQEQSQPVVTPPPAPFPEAPEIPPLMVNPYPIDMHQKVVQPLPHENPETATATTSEIPSSPDIINLANNSELSVETLAKEARRIQDATANDDELYLSLR